MVVLKNGDYFLKHIDPWAIVKDTSSVRYRWNSVVLHRLIPVPKDIGNMLHTCILHSKFLIIFSYLGKNVYVMKFLYRILPFCS